MSEQRVYVTNNDVGFAIFVLMCFMLIGGCNLSAQLCERLKGIEQAIEKQPPSLPQPQVKGDATK
jgi:hypothetical protein